MRRVIYRDETTDTVEVSINEHYAEIFIKCLLESNYMVSKKGDGANVLVKFRKDDE